MDNNPTNATSYFVMTEKIEATQDAFGAAMFTIAVILTYTFCITCIIAGFSFRKRRLIEQEREASQFLKYRRDILQSNILVFIYI